MQSTRNFGKMDLKFLVILVSGVVIRKDVTRNHQTQFIFDSVLQQLQFFPNFTIILQYDKCLLSWAWMYSYLECYEIYYSFLLINLAKNAKN